MKTIWWNLVLNSENKNSKQTNVLFQINFKKWRGCKFSVSPENSSGSRCGLFSLEQRTCKSGIIKSDFNWRKLSAIICRPHGWRTGVRLDFWTLWHSSGLNLRNRLRLLLDFYEHVGDAEGERARHVDQDEGVHARQQHAAQPGNDATQTVHTNKHKQRISGSDNLQIFTLRSKPSPNVSSWRRSGIKNVPDDLQTADSQETTRRVPLMWLMSYFFSTFDSMLVPVNVVPGNNIWRLCLSTQSDSRNRLWSNEKKNRRRTERKQRQNPFTWIIMFITRSSQHQDAVGKIGFCWTSHGQNKHWCCGSRSICCLLVSELQCLCLSSGLRPLTRSHGHNGL